jgi:hypothetical protein
LYPSTAGGLQPGLGVTPVYRERFGGSRLRPLTLRTVLLAVLSAAVFVLSALLLVSTLR